MTPLRVGFLVDGLTLPAWQRDLIVSVRSEPGLECALFVVRVAPPVPEPAPPLLLLYEQLDRTLDRHRNTLLEPVSLDPAGTAVLNVTPVAGATDLRLDAADVTRLRDQRLDVLVRLGFDGLAGEAAGAARGGTWAVWQGDGEGRSGRPGLWEMIEEHTVTSARLVALDASGAGKTIDRAVCATHGYSLLRTCGLVAAAAINLVLRRLRQVRDHGPESLPLTHRPAERSGVPSTPGTPALIAFIGRFAFRVFARIAAVATRDVFHWRVAVARRSDAAAPGARLRRDAFHDVPQPADQFYADPFLFEHQGADHLFMEVYSYRTGRGTIAVTRLDAGGRAAPPVTALERPYHLSYPLVFSWKGETFMIPETRSQRTVELYRCERFPDRWTLDSVLLRDIEAADATVAEIEGRLWLFVCVATRGMSPDTELCLFHTTDVRGPWRPHAMNPVISDVRAARPAGRLWNAGGGWIRPAQDCSVRYGYGLSFARITTLSPDEYAEEVVARLAPGQLGWPAEGIHTWNVSERFCAIDFNAPRFRLARWLGRS